MEQTECVTETFEQFKEIGKIYLCDTEINPGLPFHYFDCVYSIYGIGWTMDINKVFYLGSRYLKASGTFIFSRDNPLLQCLKSQDA